MLCLVAALIVTGVNDGIDFLFGKGHAVFNRFSWSDMTGVCRDEISLVNSIQRFEIVVVVGYSWIGSMNQKVMSFLSQLLVFNLPGRRR
jgi:hypothetical protein